MASSRPAPEGDDVPLRERKRRLTRRAILEAVAEIELVHGGAIDPSVITYARIAEIAGVSERTVYRFFPTKAALDVAYTEDQPMLLGAEPPSSVDRYPDMLETFGQLWAERTGDLRVEEHEVDTEDYPLSFQARRDRDAALVDDLMTLAGNAEELGPHQRRALTAAIHSAASIRSIAITAQRWNLTIAEASSAHAWTLRRLFEALAETPPDPWEDDHA